MNDKKLHANIDIDINNMDSPWKITFLTENGNVWRAVWFEEEEFRAIIRELRKNERKG